MTADDDPLRTVRKAADQVVTATVALQNDTELALSVEAGATYAVSAWICYAAASNTPDLRTNYTYPTGSTFKRSEYGPPSASTTVADVVDVGMATTGDNGRGAGTAERSMWVQGDLVVGPNAGTFRFVFAQVTSSADAVTVKAGSRLTLQKL
ncbi:hypothetical protein [Actinoplanes sp. NPDC048796]|uniref:hypothetical protein n=1 Tax=Actinoplanes sp. NPDC048796 TaxID=3155640 RepID=UPI0033D3C875